MRIPASIFQCLAVVFLLMNLGCNDVARQGDKPATSKAQDSVLPMPVSASASSSQPEPSVAFTPPDTSSSSSAEVTKKKTSRPMIYDDTANGQDLIAKAVRRAKRDHKQVLIEWGGNWCGWCHLLHDTFHHAPGVRELIAEEYELVLIDSNTNQELMAEYGGKDRQFSYPHLTVLDSEGTVLVNQNTAPLEEGHAHSPEKVAAFLKEWMLPKVDAEKLFSAALDRAKQENKRILFTVGTPYCGWCKRLAQFLMDHETLFAKDFVSVKIDTLRMLNGEKVAHAHRPPNCIGDPWFIILNSDGETLQTSVAKEGNIGCPSSPDEVAHFIKILRETRQSMTDTELAAIETDLHNGRLQREQQRVQ